MPFITNILSDNDIRTWANTNFRDKWDDSLSDTQNLQNLYEFCTKSTSMLSQALAIKKFEV